MKRKTENRGDGRSPSKMGGRPSATGGGGERAKHEAKDTPSHRMARVEAQIRDVISSYLLSRMRGKLTGIVSVTRVIAASDIRAARVLITAMDPTGESGLDAAAFQKDTIEKLKLQAYDIQEEIDHTLRMKFCPKLTFAYDEGFEHAMKVENILRKISTDHQAATKAAGGDAGADGVGGSADVSSEASDKDAGEDEA